MDLPNTLTVAEYKATLDNGVPIEFVRRAKQLFCVRHFSADAMDNRESAEPDALSYSNFMWEFLPSAVVPASKTTQAELGNQVVSGIGSQFDFLWEDGAFGKLGHNNQRLYIDPARECVGVYFSASVLPNYPMGYMRAAALSLGRQA